MKVMLKTVNTGTQIQSDGKADSSKPSLSILDSAIDVLITAITMALTAKKVDSVKLRATTQGVFDKAAGAAKPTATMENVKAGNTCAKLAAPPKFTCPCVA